MTTSEDLPDETPDETSDETPDEVGDEVEGFGVTSPSVKGSMFDILGGGTTPGTQASLTEEQMRRLSRPPS